MGQHQGRPFQATPQENDPENPVVEPPLSPRGIPCSNLAVGRTDRLCMLLDETRKNPLDEDGWDEIRLLVTTKYRPSDRLYQMVEMIAASAQMYIKTKVGLAIDLYLTWLLLKDSKDLQIRHSYLTGDLLIATVDAKVGVAYFDYGMTLPRDEGVKLNAIEIWKQRLETVEDRNCLYMLGCTSLLFEEKVNYLHRALARHHKLAFGQLYQLMIKFPDCRDMVLAGQQWQPRWEAHRWFKEYHEAIFTFLIIQRYRLPYPLNRHILYHIIRFICK
ncbi:MAG: hypothetical protein ACMG6E_05045 [Candidatus Roizmanbacteria bacterium]